MEIIKKVVMLFTFLVFVPGQAESFQASMPHSATGWFTILWGDGHSNSDGKKTRYTLTDDTGKTTRLFVSDTVARSIGGVLSINRKRVAVKGSLASVPASGGSSSILKVSSIQILPSVSPLTEGLEKSLEHAVSGSKPWISIMCKFSDYADEPKDLSYFIEMYSNVKPGFDHYWREQSYGQVNVVGSGAAGWYTLPHPESYYNPSDTRGGTDLDLLASDCIGAADASVDFEQYDGINMMFNSNFDNGYAWGGGRYMTLDGVSKVWRTTWEPPWGYSDITVIAHEMGHGFGLPHSSGAYGKTYDNVWDVMSDTWSNCDRSSDPIYGCLGQHTIAYHKDILGWIPADQKYIANRNGTVLLDHIALSSTANYRMIQIPIAGLGTHFYTVEVRQMEGYDVKLPGKAVIIHEVDTTRPRPANVIDADGNGNTGDAGAMWTAGETFTDAANKIKVKVLSGTPTGFKVSIETPDKPKGYFPAIQLLLLD